MYKKSQENTHKWVAFLLRVPWISRNPPQPQHKRKPYIAFPNPSHPTGKMTVEITGKQSSPHKNEVLRSNPRRGESKIRPKKGNNQCDDSRNPKNLRLKSLHLPQSGVGKRGADRWKAETVDTCHGSSARAPCSLIGTEHLLRAHTVDAVSKRNWLSVWDHLKRDVPLAHRRHVSMG